MIFNPTCECMDRGELRRLQGADVTLDKLAKLGGFRRHREYAPAAARDLGATNWQVAWRGVLPVLAEAVATGARSPPGTRVACYR